MRRKIVSLMLILALMLSLTSAVSAATAGNSATTEETDFDYGDIPEPSDEQLAQWKADRQKMDAEVLKYLGLFLGTDKGFELDRAPTRTESVVLLLRMLGQEQEALNSNYTHPFKDVPAWANKYIAYAYNKGLTSGTSATTFGSSDTTTPEQFFTFTLRALGYNDKNGDFIYRESINKVVELGLAAEGDYTFGSKSFIRGDCASIMYSALSKNLNGGDQRLIDKLVTDGIVPKDKAAEAGFVQNEPGESESDIVSFDTGFYAEIGEASSVMVYIVKSELPTELQSAVYFGVGSTSNDVTFDTFKSWLVEDNKKASLEKMKNTSKIDGIDGMSGTRVVAGDVAAITLFDSNGRAIGLRLIKPEEYVSGDPHFIYFEISYSGAYEKPTSTKPYLAKRYINGIEDTSFEQPRGGPYGSNGEPGKNLHVFYQTPVLFVKDNSVTYKIIDLDPSIPKNIAQKVYGK